MYIVSNIYDSSFYVGCAYFLSVKYYVKVFLPEYYCNTSYNNILKLLVNREGEQPATVTQLTCKGAGL